MHNERYFNKFDFVWKSIYLLQPMVTVDTKLRFFSIQNTRQYFFVNKMLFKCSLKFSFYKAEDETYIHLFLGAEKLPFYGETSGVF